MDMQVRDFLLPDPPRVDDDAKAVGTALCGGNLVGPGQHLPEHQCIVFGVAVASEVMCFFGITSTCTGRAGLMSLKARMSSSS
jgi:hypothetical protein